MPAGKQDKEREINFCVLVLFLAFDLLILYESQTLGK